MVNVITNTINGQCYFADSMWPTRPCKYGTQVMINDLWYLPVVNFSVY